MSSWLLKNLTAVTMDDDRRVLSQADILIQGNHIAGIGDTGTLTPDKSCQIIDASGQVAIPGLINAHTHCAMTLFRGYADDMPLMPWLQERIWPLEAKLQPGDVYWGTQLGIAEMIRAGVTCFNDMYHAFEETAQAALDAQMRAVVSGVLLGFLPNAEEMLQHAIAFAGEWSNKGDGLLTTMLGPHAPYTVQDAFFEQVIAAATGLNVGIHIHVAETRGELEDSLRDHGKTPVQRLSEVGLFAVQPVVAAHCVHLTPDDITVLAENYVGIVHCPGSNMKLASGIAPIPALLAAGAVVGLGADGPASNNNLDMIEEARLAALLHKVNGFDPTIIPACTALELATRGSAQALGLGDRIGQLTVGKQADIALLDFDRPHLLPRHDVISHVVYASQAGDVRTVFINGRPVMRDRALLTMDLTEIYTQLRTRVAHLTA